MRRSSRACNFAVSTELRNSRSTPRRPRAMSQPARTPGTVSAREHPPVIPQPRYPPSMPPFGHKRGSDPESRAHVASSVPRRHREGCFPSLGASTRMASDEELITMPLVLELSSELPAKLDSYMSSR
jgi:hypothetical protein